MTIHAESRNPRVLIVEDDGNNKMLYRALAKRLQFECVIVGTCKEAEMLVRATRFDLIVVDWVLPDGDGTELARCLRQILQQSEQSVPIVCVTARVMLGDKEECLSKGLDDFLGKPFSIEGFEVILRKWTRQQQMTEAEPDTKQS